MAGISRSFQKNEHCYTNYIEVPCLFVEHSLHLAIDRSILLINVISGHLGSGDWKFKTENNVTFLVSVQPFNRHGEYRMGPNQILGYEIEQTLEKSSIINIKLSEERYCRAKMPTHDLAKLDTMVNSSDIAPEFKRQNDRWIGGLLAFISACLIYELLK